MTKKHLSECRSSGDFLNYGEKQGAWLEAGAGSCIKVCTERGKAIVHHHPGDLAKGTRAALVKAFLALGLGALLAGLVMNLAGLAHLARAMSVIVP